MLRTIPGLAVAAGIALLAVITQNAIVLGGEKPVSSVIIAIAGGMLFRSMFGLPAVMLPGFSYSFKTVLRVAIVLLGLSLSLAAVVRTGAAAAFIIIICVVVALVITALMARAAGLSDRLGALIGVGTAICGATAIVATDPAIEAEDDEVAYSVATITLFGILAIGLYPLMGNILGLTDLQFGTWAGTAVNETAQVVATGFIFSDRAGEIATIVKLTRTAMLVPVVLVMSVVFGMRIQRQAGARWARSAFPWFLMGFILMAALRTVGDNLWSQNIYWTVLLNWVKVSAKFLVVMAMVGVGFLTDFNKMKKVGLKPFAVGLVAAAVMGGLSLGLIMAFHL